MGIADFLGGGIIKAIGDIADNLITTDKERLELDIKKQELSLKELELDYKAINDENTNITQRWQADMSSDSWLSKNIRPITLIYILTAYTFFSVGSAFDIKVTQEYVQLMGQWGMLIMSAYFGGRTIEKIIEMKTKRK